MGTHSAGEADSVDVRSRILEAAARLVADGGMAALTTRAVAAQASVQAPTIYRLFGDKSGLLDAVAQYQLAAFVAQKAAVEPHPDPVQDLREAWDAYIAFGLGNPAVFAIINEIGRAGPPSAAAMAGIRVLEQRVQRIARAGRLRIPEQRAVALIHAAGTGTIATLLASAEHARDPHLSATARDAVLAAVVGDQQDGVEHDAAAFAVGLRAHLDALDVLSPGETLLLHELLDRISKRQD